MATAPDAAPGEVEVRLWDGPVRLVHWGFVLLIPAMWASAEFGQMQAHRAMGYAALFLLLFRLYWGVAGSATARFASFVRGPGAILRYVRSGATVIGHNPLGALSVVALLALLGLQIGLGLIAQDTDGEFAGPLARLVSYETSRSAGDWHEAMFNLLLVLIALHVAAILFYLIVRRDNLVRPMLTGRKRVRTTVEQPQAGSAGHAIAGVVLSAAVTAWIAAGAPL
jgi:cytochrome b